MKLNYRKGKTIVNWKKRKRLQRAVNNYNSKYHKTNGRMITQHEYKYIIQKRCYIRSVYEYELPFPTLNSYGGKRYRTWDNRVHASINRILESDNATRKDRRNINWSLSYLQNRLCILDMSKLIRKMVNPYVD